MPTVRLTARLCDTLAAPTNQPRVDYWDTELTGLCLRISANGTRVFALKARVGGKQTRVTIGELGAIRPDGAAWTLALARVRAKALLGQMASGVSPNAKAPVVTAQTITLGQALELHLGEMRKRNCSERSLTTMAYLINTYLTAWLARPIAGITGAALNALHSAKTATGNLHLANNLVGAFSAVWNTVDRLHELPVRNPAQRVRRNRVQPPRTRLADADLPGWRNAIEELSPLRRDFYLFLLHTGLRSADARTVKWSEIDVAASTLHRPSPKGGSGKAFTLPLPSAMVALLQRRKAENAALFDAFGGDHGWAFPGLSGKAPRRVQPMSQPKENRRGLPGPHVMRRTYISIGREIGIPEIDMHVLANHSFSAGRVQDQYVRQSLAHLAACQERIAAALATRLGNVRPSAAQP